jgi:hypothetical protein
MNQMQEALRKIGLTPTQDPARDPETGVVQRSGDHEEVQRSGDHEEVRLSTSDVDATSQSAIEENLVEYAAVPGDSPNDRAAVLFGQDAVQYARASGVPLRHPDLVTKGALERLEDDAHCMRSRLDWDERMRAVERLGAFWCELGPGDVAALGDLARSDRDARRVDGSDRYLRWGGQRRPSPTPASAGARGAPR